MSTIYEKGTYAIKERDAETLCIFYEGELLCKYVNTHDGIRDLIGDIIYFEVEDGIIRRGKEKAREIELLAKLLNAKLPKKCK